MSEPDEVARVRHLCVKCKAEWPSPACTRCEACGLIRSQYSKGLHQGDIDGHARGKREERERAAETAEAVWLHNCGAPNLAALIAAAIRHGEDGE